MSRRAFLGVGIATLAAGTGCETIGDAFLRTELEEAILGMKHSDALIPRAYDALVGGLDYRNDDAVLFYGPDCRQPFDATPALESLSFYDSLDSFFLDEERRELTLYARWDEQISEYNIDVPWLLLNCSDYQYLVSGFIAENYGDPSDSYAHISCQYFDTYLRSCTHQEEISYDCEGY